MRKLIMYKNYNILNLPLYFKQLLYTVNEVTRIDLEHQCT